MNSDSDAVISLAVATSIHKAATKGTIFASDAIIEIGIGSALANTSGTHSWNGATPISRHNPKTSIT